ncbi:MAG: Maf family protein [Candidatus Saccharimonadales bacterium]
MRKIILASQSPRRKELLTAMGVEFTVVPSNFDEQLDDSRSPEVVAIELAVGKASEVSEKFPEAIVIGSDTIVTINGHQLEKPRDTAEAYEMLELLSGTHNEVTTSLAVICKADGTLLTGADTTKVHFKPYNQQAVKAYVETGDTVDKAAAYGIQSGAAPLIDHIEGRYDTVVGLPTLLLSEYLAQLGVTAKTVDLDCPVRQI